MNAKNEIESFYNSDFVNSVQEGQNTSEVNVLQFLLKIYGSKIHQKVLKFNLLD